MAEKFFIVLLLVGAMAGAGDSGDGERFAAEALYVVDGDSVRLRNRARDFRLCGINAPEYGRTHYGRSRKMLADLLADGEFVFWTMTRDKYGRDVVVIFPADKRAEQTSINEILVRDGAAWHFKRYSRSCLPLLTPAQLHDAQNEARRRRLGLWAPDR